MFRTQSANTRRSDRFPHIQEEKDGEAEEEGEEEEAATVRHSHASSTSSATERLQWRNHAAVLTPSAQSDNPFNNIHLTTTHRTASHPPTPADNATTTTTTTTTPSPQPLTLTFKQRIRHFTWTWFTLTMATGGLANVLYTLPFRFRGLYALGCFFFLLNIALFVFNVVMMGCRFYWYPRTFRASLVHPTESLFIPGATVSFGIICLNVSQYGVGAGAAGSWLERVMVVLFWADCGLACCFSVGIYLIM